MSIRIIPRLKTQQTIPDFQLPATDNRQIRISQFRQRKNLVLYFFGKVDCKPCRDKLTELNSKLTNFERFNSKVFAISPETLDGLKKLKKELAIEFELLSDVRLNAANLYTQLKPDKSEPYPSIFLIDRYNVLYAQAIEQSEKNLPTIKDIFRVLHSIEIECPECGFFPGSTSI